MTWHATAAFDYTNWEEKDYNEVEGLPRLTQAHVSNLYQGEIEGQGALEYLLCYSEHEQLCYFTGLERFIGRIGERSGSFVLHHTGIYQQEGVTTNCRVIKGSGTGDFLGLQGNGTYIAQNGQTASFTLQYEIA